MSYEQTLPNKEYINSQKFRRKKIRRKNFGGTNFGHFFDISAENISDTFFKVENFSDK